LPLPGGKPRKFIRTCGGIGEKIYIYIYIFRSLFWHRGTWNSFFRGVGGRAPREVKIPSLFSAEI
jgi:hypothetical protein